MDKKKVINGLIVTLSLGLMTAMVIAGCGGGGGGGIASGGGDTIVIALDGGAPVTYSEGPMIQGMPDPAILSSVENYLGTDETMIMMMANHSSVDQNDDVMLIIMFEGTAAGDYPIDSTGVNTVLLMDSTNMYAPPQISPTGTIQITRYDGSRIEGEIVGTMLEDPFNPPSITFDCNFSLTPGFDIPGGIP